uniref:Uncharacterized protein n=1 Tax=Glossina morsitans morsitans TaxID=37546 RepID=A0A1B0G300_GLOMM
MIGTDEMSSTGMDISESFRPEDISKTDFFDFVTAPDMGLGLGVNLHHHHSHQQHHHHHHQQQQQQQQQQHTNQHNQHHHSHHHHHPHHHHGSQQQQQHHPSAGDNSSMTHDSGGGGGGGGSVGSTNNGSGNSTNNTSDRVDPHGDNTGISDANRVTVSDAALQGYEFWNTDKEQSRLESTIFDDLDRYCWQHQTNSSSAPNASSSLHHHTTPSNVMNPPVTHTVPANASSTDPPSSHSHSTNLLSSCSNSQTAITTSSSSLNTAPQITQTPLNNDGSISSVINTDGQIYTLKVLNGTESWLKREPDSQLNNTLDLDSLLNSFHGYIKSEYSYDDSGFSADGTKDVSSGDATNCMNSLNAVAGDDTGSGGGNGLGSLSNTSRLPSLMSTLASVTNNSIGVIKNENTTSPLPSIVSQQIDQFQNNNNDWHMTDHNSEQNSAESLLRSALQGKGYSKGLHMHNGITLMPTSPTVKDDEMRRMLFPVDTDALGFTDSSLNAAQIFEDTQTASSHSSHLVVTHSPHINGPLTPVNSSNNGGNTGGHTNPSAVSNIIVDDMFLSLENAFNIANEVQQFCTPSASANDFPSNEVIMPISANDGAINATGNTQLPSLHSVTGTSAATGSEPTTPTGGPTPIPSIGVVSLATSQHNQTPSQPLKSEVTTSSNRIGSSTKVTKKYKRTMSTVATAVAAHHNNNNNPNGNSSKHHRNNATTLSNPSSVHSHNPRSLTLIPNISTAPGPNGNIGIVGGIISNSASIPLNVATAPPPAPPSTPSTLLPPANGLLINR